MHALLLCQLAPLSRPAVPIVLNHKYAARQLAAGRVVLRHEHQASQALGWVESFAVGVNGSRP